LNGKLSQAERLAVVEAKLDDHVRQSGEQHQILKSQMDILQETFVAALGEVKARLDALSIWQQAVQRRHDHENGVVTGAHAERRRWAQLAGALGAGLAAGAAILEALQRLGVL
jgi:hypothetical protein